MSLSRLSRPTRTLVAASLAASVAVPAFATSASAAPPPTCDGRPATVVGTTGDDTLTGTSGNDVIWAGPGDDVVRAGRGDDVVCGNAGADTLVGGAGDDRLLGLTDAVQVDRGGTYLQGDVLRGGPGDDLLDVGVDERETTQGSFGNEVSWSTSATGVVIDLRTLRATGEGTDTIVGRPQVRVVGSPHDDTIEGSDGPDLLVGGAGDDTIDGHGGDDEIDPEDAQSPPVADDDTVDGGDGADRVISALGRDVLHGGQGDDTVGSFSPQRSEVYGDVGDDDVFLKMARTGGYVLDGGQGDDTAELLRPDLPTSGGEPSGPTPTAVLDLQAGTLRVGWATPTEAAVRAVEETTLDDYVTWNVFGTSAADVVHAGYFHRLQASMRGGDDVVYGSSRDDRVNGGPGFDAVGGDLGDDVCVAVEKRVSCAAG